MKILFALAALLPCACAAPSQKLQIWGSLHAVMAEGKTGPTVALADVPGPHAYALGALAGLRGEVLILDDKVLASYVDGDHVRIDPRAGAEKATLLVATRVRDWSPTPVAADIPAAELDTRVAELAAAAGVDTGKPFPFRVEGRFQTVAWHVMDGSKLPPSAGHDERMQAAMKGTTESAQGSALGFYSTSHVGVFTHMGKRTHVHVWLPAVSVMGHADELGVAAGSVIYFPRRG